VWPLGKSEKAIAREKQVAEEQKAAKEKHYLNIGTGPYGHLHPTPFGAQQPGATETLRLSDLASC